jgi:hypothetical protein
VTPSEFKASFPDGEFSSLADNYVQTFLDKADPFFDVERWGDFYSEGVANFVAHKIVLSKARAANALQVNGGNVTEEHVGPVGQSMDSQLLNKQVDDPYLLTDYGQEYVRLRRLVGMGGTAA